MSAPEEKDFRDPLQKPLSVEAASARITQALAPIEGTETVSIRDALGRILAQDVASTVDVPPHTNSAMDGYALAGTDLPQNESRELAVVGAAWAGRPFDGTVQTGTCVQIMTGAVMPQGTDTVIMQEQVQREAEAIRIGADHRTGQNVRAAGEDLKRGEVVLQAGRRLVPSDLGLLASIGFAETTVKRRLKVACFSTGDELRSPGESLEEGAIFDSNRYTVYGMLARLGAEVHDMGIVRDDRGAMRDAFEAASTRADVVVASGGVSVGDADYVKEILGELGHVGFWKVAIKPGRPLAFGQIGNARFFGLPGNPVAVMVTFYQFVSPALRRMMGEIEPEPPLTIEVPCVSRLPKRPGRTEYVRGILAQDADGKLVVRSTGKQGSGILRSMSLANCFIVLPADAGGVEPGAVVRVQPFAGLA